MKSKITLLFFLIFQFSFSQETRKSLHGEAENTVFQVDGGYVINLNTKSKTFISSQGFFDILAKAKDTLLVSSLAFKPKKIVLSETDFSTSLFKTNLEIQETQLAEVVIKKEKIKPKLAFNSQKYVDMQFFDDKYSSPKNRLMPPDGTIENGMDFVAIGKKIIKLFVKNKPEKITEIDFATMIHKTISNDFFVKNLKIKEEKINLFLAYCDNDPKSKAPILMQNKFYLIDFLISKSQEFKSLPTFEK